MKYHEKLNRGETVGLVCTSSGISEGKLEECIKAVTELGFKAKIAENITKNYGGYMAGTARERADQLNSMFADDEVKGIFCVRGGFGSSRIMEYVDFDLIKSHPKVFVGYSDVTNLHIARPWLFDKELSVISDQYKIFMASAAAENPALNAFTSQIKVEGIMAYIGMLPNGAYFSDENLKQCRELVGHDNIDKDVAILQLETKRLPDTDCHIVNVDQAVIEDSEIKVGSHIYTMGFPFGLSLQDLKTSKGIRILANGGSITQECTEYSFGFNAPSYGGASGSPIFNAKGQLIGVLNAGVSRSQGFNYGIKAVHVKELLNQAQSK